MRALLASLLLLSACGPSAPVVDTVEMLGVDRFRFEGTLMDGSVLAAELRARAEGATEPSSQPMRLVMDADLPWKDAVHGVAAVLSPPGRTDVTIAARGDDGTRESSIPVLSGHLCRALHFHDGPDEFDGHAGPDRYVFVNAWLDAAGPVRVDGCTFEDQGRPAEIELGPVPDALATGAPLSGSSLDLAALRRWFDDLARKEVRPLLVIDHEPTLPVGRLVAALADAREALGVTRVMLGPTSWEPEPVLEEEVDGPEDAPSPDPSTEDAPFEAPDDG